MDRPPLHTALQNQLQNRTVTTTTFLDMLMNVLQYNQTNIISCSGRTRPARSHLFSNKEPCRNVFTN